MLQVHGWLVIPHRRSVRRVCAGQTIGEQHNTVQLCTVLETCHRMMRERSARVELRPEIGWGRRY